MNDRERIPLFNRIKLIAFVLINIIFGITTAPKAELLPLEYDGVNPGELAAYIYTNNIPTKSLLVLLHGCGQDSQTFTKKTGLLEAAERKNFMLLLPQQTKSNNAQLCFNWFSPIDQHGDKGESASIIAMINFVKSKYAITDIYIAGLSAGGSMTSNLISLHPGLFHSAAIISGIGYPCADDLVKAISCMKNGMVQDLLGPATILLNQQKQSVQWPNLSVITGTSDNIVNPKNSNQLAELWSLILHTNTTETKQISGASLHIKRNQQNNKFVSLIEIDGMGHGWPVNSEQEFGGKPSMFVPEASISAANYIINLWAL